MTRKGVEFMFKGIKLTIPFFTAYTSAIHNKKEFFEEVKRQLKLKPEDKDFEKIKEVYEIVEKAFKHHNRDNGEGYFEHMRAVALTAMSNTDIVIASLDHDLVEDIPGWTIDRIGREHGAHIAYLVGFMTKPSKYEFTGKTNMERRKKRNRYYYNKIKKAPKDFFKIKLADLLHNLTTLWDCEEYKIHNKIWETKHVYLPYAKKYNILVKELGGALKELIEHIESLKKTKAVKEE